MNKIFNRKLRIAQIVFILFYYSISLVYSQPAENIVEEGNTLITIHAEDAFLPSILAILARESGYNIVTDPNVNKQDKVSIHLDNVPIEQAINLVVRAVGLSYEVVGNSFGDSLEEHQGKRSHTISLKKIILMV